MDFFKGIFLGEIGVAHFIFDHQSGGLFGRLWAFADSAQGPEESQKKVDQVDQESVENNLNHLHYFKCRGIRRACQTDVTRGKNFLDCSPGKK